MTGRIIAVTGGAGYIGSHIVDLLIKNGDTPIVIDDFSTGHMDTLKALGNPIHYDTDIRDTSKLIEIFKNHKPDALINFAAKSLVGESKYLGLQYWDNNMAGALSIVNAMHQTDVKHIVSSSTAATYGQPEGTAPLHEGLETNPINVYGRTKLSVEHMLQDTEEETGITFVCPRYFNAAGADPEGKIGEKHHPETHLIPLVIQAALGQRKKIDIYGTDYETRDGTCIRDYIDVSDLARAHVQAVDYLISGGKSVICNLGTGDGSTVKEIISAVKEATGNHNFTVVEAPRREGDPSILVAEAKLAKAAFNWSAQETLETTIKNAVAWHQTEDSKNFFKKHNPRNG